MKRSLHEVAIVLHTTYDLRKFFGFSCFLFLVFMETNSFDETFKFSFEYCLVLRTRNTSNQ